MGDVGNFVRVKNCVRGVLTEKRPRDIQADVAEGKKLGGELLDFVKWLYQSVKPVFCGRHPELVILQTELVRWLIIRTDRRQTEYDGR